MIVETAIAAALLTARCPVPDQVPWGMPATVGKVVRPDHFARIPQPERLIAADAWTPGCGAPLRVVEDGPSGTVLSARRDRYLLGVIPGVAYNGGQRDVWLFYWVGG